MFMRVLDLSGNWGTGFFDPETLMKSVQFIRSDRAGLWGSRIVRALLVALVGTNVSGCAMQLGSMFGSSPAPEATTGSISSPAPAARSLALAANDMAAANVSAQQVGAAGACPSIVVGENGAQLTIYRVGQVGDSLAIRYRGEISRTARECEIAPGMVSVKYGVAGRVLLGPLGKAGTFRLPVLVHVTDRSGNKILTRKLGVKVRVVEGKPYGNYSTVQNLSFSVAPGVPASQYKIYVGFDQKAQGAGRSVQSGVGADYSGGAYGSTSLLAAGRR